MHRTGGVLCLMLCVAALPASGEERVALGYGDLFNNDAIGDGQDRWRTASYTASWLYGPAWGAEAAGRPAALGEILEFRLRAEAITASNSVNPAPGDRRYAGILGVGLHSHAARQGLEVSAGAGLAFVGPMTGVSEVQKGLHGLFGMAEPDTSGQLPDAVYPDVTLEVARPFRIGGALQLRPFAEAVAGLETMLRAGGDLRIGRVGTADLTLRDSVTGQRYPGLRGGAPAGVSLVLGADVAHVFDSYLLRGADGYVAHESRSRVRAGVRWQGESASAFYGVTWMSEEFTAQPEAQAVGSLQLRLQF